MSKPFYITTPIYYPNGEPHLGHVYSTLCCDVVARYRRLNGEETFFLTGVDEHGLKMVKTASELGTTPKELADKNAAAFENCWREFRVTNDDFIRTSSDRHKSRVEAIYNKLLANDDIYLGEYAGWYDEGQEEFVTETEAKANEYKSAVSGRPLTKYSEPTYFFRLTKYVERVFKLIESDEMLVRPIARKNEVLSKLKGWDQDLSISRATLTWGIPLPNDPKHVLYVWIDALSNYVTALGFGGEDDALFKKYLAGGCAFDRQRNPLVPRGVLAGDALVSLGLPNCQGKLLFAHGWWTSGGRKMSKSLGNFIDLDKVRSVVATYGLDALRFYLLRAAPFGNDLDWQDAEVAKAYSELGNVVGNLLNRVLKMVGKYRDGVVPEIGDRADVIDGPMENDIERVVGDLRVVYDNVELQRAVTLPVELARQCNAYIDATAPFTLAKDPAKAGRLDTVLALSTRAIYVTLVALLPVMPEKAVAGLAQLNVVVERQTLDTLFAHRNLAGKKLGEGVPLWPRLEV